MRTLLLALLLAACSTDDGLDDDDSAAFDDDDTADVEPERVAALDLVAVTANQGVEIQLMQDGDPADRNGPLIANRNLLLRAYVEPQAGYENTIVLGRLLWDGEVYEDQTPITGASEAGDLDSTLSWVVDAADVRTDSSFRIELWDTRGGPGPDGNRHSWPDDGEEDLDATSAGGTLKVVVVPIQWNVDGSGRLPDTSQEQLDIFAALLSRVFPAREVSVEVGPILEWDRALDDEAWSDLLNAVLELRNMSNIDVDEYWYGLFQGAETIADWCQGPGGCRMGLGFVLDDYNSYWARAGLGTGFDPFQATGTLAHELGHLHGRYHADCGGAEGIDWLYPYDDAELGAWGWDIFGGLGLIDPEETVDMMSYCDPVWVSDYTYERLHNRMRLVEAALAIQGPPVEGWSVSVGADGRIGPARRMSLPLEPGGRTVDGVDAQGRPMTGAFVRALHTGGGLAVFPREPAAGLRLHVE